MLTLAFDTTADCCAVALLKDNLVVEKFSEEMDFGQAEVLIPQIQAMLQKQNLTFSELNLLAVCVGPGSFTGVRSSIAAARAFGLACPELKITGVSAFEAYVHSLDMSELSDYNAEALPYEEIINRLKGKTVTLIGNGVERFLDKPSGLVLHAIRMDKTASISDLAACALQKFQHKKLNYPKPLYLRAPDVCVKS